MSKVQVDSELQWEASLKYSRTALQQPPPAYQHLFVLCHLM